MFSGYESDFTMFEQLDRPPMTSVQPFTKPYDTKTCTKQLRINGQRASLTFLACGIYEVLSNSRIKVAHHLDHSSFCVDIMGMDIETSIVDQIKLKMNEIVSSGLQIELVTVGKQELVTYFQTLGYKDKAKTIQYMKQERIMCSRIGNYLDITLDTVLETDTSALGNFDIRAENGGLFLRFPALLADGVVRDWRGPPLQHKLLLEFGEWVTSIGSNSVDDLNQLVEDEKIPEINDKCDDFNKKELADIAKDLTDHFPQKRIITIAGPSSSGKSTFSKILYNHLKELGFDVLIISMDSFFVDRLKTPLDAEGKYDFESLRAMHIEMMSDRLHALLHGEKVPKRIYNFVEGLGHDLEETISVDAKGFLILEGIHGLNPELLDLIGNDTATKIFVAPMTPILIDSEHCFKQPDLLLLRRIIRDYNERGYSARKNVGWWPDVAAGEARNITPNLRQADLFYNSSLAYELSVLANVGIPILREALSSPPEEDDPKIVIEVTAESQRLLSILEMIRPIPARNVPHNSCIYEFIHSISKKTVV